MSIFKATIAVQLDEVRLDGVPPPMTDERQAALIELAFGSGFISLPIGQTVNLEMMFVTSGSSVSFRIGSCEDTQLAPRNAEADPVESLRMASLVAASGGA